MDDMILYKTIFERRSIRKYKKEEIDTKTLNEISRFSKTVDKLCSDIKTSIKFITKVDISKLTPVTVSAPHYIAFFSEKKPGWLENVGYMASEMDLYLSSIGIGSCFIGFGKPSKEVIEEDLNFVIMLAFGIPDEALHRENALEFKRKDLNEITNNPNKVMKAVRLAPSSMNSQPWYYEKEENHINVYLKSNVIKNIILSNINFIDIGISLRYLTLALKNENKDFKFGRLEDKKVKNGKYVISIQIL